MITGILGGKGNCDEFDCEFALCEKKSFEMKGMISIVLWETLVPTPHYR